MRQQRVTVSDCSRSYYDILRIKPAEHAYRYILQQVLFESHSVAVVAFSSFAAACF
jgi:hypothetical protein